MADGQHSEMGDVVFNFYRLYFGHKDLFCEKRNKSDPDQKGKESNLSDNNQNHKDNSEKTLSQKEANRNPNTNIKNHFHKNQVNPTENKSSKKSTDKKNKKKMSFFQKFLSLFKFKKKKNKKKTKKKTNKKGHDLNEKEAPAKQKECSQIKEALIEFMEESKTNMRQEMMDNVEYQHPGLREPQVANFLALFNRKAQMKCEFCDLEQECVLRILQKDVCLKLLFAMDLTQKSVSVVLAKVLQKRDSNGFNFRLAGKNTQVTDSEGNKFESDKNNNSHYDSDRNRFSRFGRYRADKAGTNRKSQDSLYSRNSTSEKSKRIVMNRQKYRGSLALKDDPYDFTAGMHSQNGPRISSNAKLPRFGKDFEPTKR